MTEQTTPPTTAQPTEEAVRAAFADLREREWARTTPPGVAAARRTVRRRWAVTRTTAGLTAILLLGSGYLAAAFWQQPAPVQPADFGPPSTASVPTPDETDWMGLDPDEVPPSGVASLAVGDTDGRMVYVTVFKFAPGHTFLDDQPVASLPASLGPPPPGAPYPVLAATGNPWGAGEDGLQPGGYRLRAACAGSGTNIDLTFRIGGLVATATPECGPTPKGARDGRAEVDLGEFTEAEIEAGLGYSIWHGDPQGRPAPQAIAFALVPTEYQRPD